MKFAEILIIVTLHKLHSTDHLLFLVHVTTRTTGHLSRYAHVVTRAPRGACCTVIPRSSLLKRASCTEAKRKAYLLRAFGGNLTALMFIFRSNARSHCHYPLPYPYIHYYTTYTRILFAQGHILPPYLPSFTPLLPPLGVPAKMPAAPKFWT